MAKQLSPPFSTTTSPLKPNRPAPAPLSGASLPAAYCDQDNELVRRGSDDASFITLDMDVSRLNHIHPYLWLAGRPTHARSLHRQRMLERQIIVTEQADLHMVWHESRLFIKPLPDYILDHQIWSDTLCKNAALHASCRGFLLSYVWLLCYPSDLKIAVELGLVSSCVTWSDWTIFVDAYPWHLLVT